MPHPILNSFIACINGGKTRAISGKKSCHLKIDQGEEEKKEQQNGIERGAVVQDGNEIDGVEKEEEEEGQHDKEWICENLPQDLMIESILTRLPARTLAICCCVNKSWYNSILNDSRFSMIHYIQNKNKLFLVFNLLNVSRWGTERTYFFSLLGGQNADIRFLSDLNIQDVFELVGFCNGLACIKLVSEPNDTEGVITVVNPIRCESLVLTFIPPTGGYIYLCHGFGFDSLSQVYKAVIVFASEDNNEFLCMVTTLGTMSWRKIIISIFDISPPLGSSPFPSRMVTRIPRILCKPATFCGGDLFWMTQNEVGDNNDKIEMLLSFDLHNEKIQFIRLPTECNTLTRATYEEGQYLVVDHLLEFKGYPCIAHTKRIIRSGNDHCGHRCNYRSGVCCCCYKLHMYILKDKDKQVWIREEILDIQIMNKEGLQPIPLCWYFGTSAAMPPTRILTFSDQVLLYWFNGECLVFYSVQEKHLKLVICSCTYPSIFRTKMNEDLERRIGADDNIYCPSMDYQLHAQVENFVSLKTFIPKEAYTVKVDCFDEWMHTINNNQPAGWRITGRKTHTVYAFF